MTNETQALLSAIETLCGKKKAKLLRRLTKAAIAAEREQVTLPWTLSTDTGSVATTHIDSISGTTGRYIAGITLT